MIAFCLVIRELHKKDELLAAALVPSGTLRERYPILWILPVLILLAGKMPAPQEILGYFFIWKSLTPNFNANLLV
jgi:hypothetical protein